MATIQDRPFSREYSGLRNQLEVGGVLVALCLSSYELMRHKRRGRGRGAKYEDGTGSVETWEFGYLYQGRCWAKNPSPGLPKWPLTWIPQAIKIQERTLPDLLGLDATLYIRFLRACVWFTVLQSCTTFPILFSIHVVFSPHDISNKSMNKASISSLVKSASGLRLLYVHVILAYWLSITWIITLLWIARGIFRYRALAIQAAAESFSHDALDEAGREKPIDENRGLRLRTVMVTNVPHQLRTDKALKEYFEYYLSRPLGTAPLTAGFLPKMMTFLFNRAAASSAVQHFRAPADDVRAADAPDSPLPAIVENVVIARKMTELASLLARREDVLRKLEYEHVRLAQTVLQAVRAHLDNPAASPERQGLLTRISSRKSWSDARKRDEETGADSAPDHAAHLSIIAETLAPFVSAFHVPSPTPIRRNALRMLEHVRRNTLEESPPFSPVTHNQQYDTIWEALHSLPRGHLDAYQPLIRLRALFRGATVPSIDYYTTKLGLLTALINENRGRSPEAYSPSSTSFVTFETIADARRAAKYMQVHPHNPLACIVVPAPDVTDLDWARIMKSSFTGEFLKDWVVNLGVWAFTCLWIIPISLFVSLVTIQNLSIFLPGLQSYLNKHPRDQEAISSLLPTILVSILTILIPMLLLLIAKKAHTIITFSKLHDTIMIRYWKFLICNLLIFFCVGVAALETFLQSFRNSVNPLPVVAASFPTAGPFYVGWLILQTAIHGFLELGLFGLPLLVYPATRAAKTLRRRAAGIRPRTFNFYYWLPNHVLVTTITVCFALLNPLVIPFALVYFAVELVIVKHQLIHVYAKPYDNNGKLILIRIVRYSLDGLILGHVVFLAFLVVLKVEVQAALSGVLLGLTVIAKIILTQLCRAKFAEGDRAEDSVYSGGGEEFVFQQSTNDDDEGGTFDADSRIKTLAGLFPNGSSRFWTWGRPIASPFTYSSVPARHRPRRRGAIPFQTNASFTRITSLEKSDGPVSHDITDASVNSPNTNMSKADASHELQASGINGRAQLPPAEDTTAAIRRVTKQPLVTPHAKHDRWDDFPHLNRPYQNPYYTQPVDNFLWLPRNPFGVLDLDDSVDLHRALTSEPGGGQLGQWMNEAIEGDIHTTPGALVETPSSIPSEIPEETVQESFPFRTRRRFSGTEEISMSSVLSARANRAHQENGVDRANSPRASSFVNRQSSIGRRPSTVKSRRPSMLLSTGYPPVATHGRSVSGTSQQKPRRPSMPLSARRPSSGTYDPVHEPDIQAEAVFMQSTLSIPLSTHSLGSRQSVGRREPSRDPVPIQEAVVEEIIAEAQVEAMDRVRHEEEEKRIKEAQTPSWWTSWLWHRSHPNDSDSSPAGG